MLLDGHWLATLTPEQKACIRLFAMDMHEPNEDAVRDDAALTHVAIADDRFHVIKRAGEAIAELRREIFFRVGAGMRAHRTRRALARQERLPRQLPVAV